MTLVYFVTWPLSFIGRVYRVTLPLVAGLATVVEFVDSHLYQSVGFHMTGLFFRVLRQAEALRQVGIPATEVLGLTIVAVAWTVFEVLVGRPFLLRFASEQRAVRWVEAMLGQSLVECLGSAVLIFYGGLARGCRGAGTSLQPPTRLNGQVAFMTGHRLCALLGTELRRRAAPRVGSKRLMN